MEFGSIDGCKDGQYDGVGVLEVLHIFAAYDEFSLGIVLENISLFWNIFHRLVAFLAGDRGVRACVDLPQVVEGIPLENNSKF